MKKHLGKEEGNVAIIVAVSISLILAFSAIVIDIGRMYIVAGEVQNIADAAVFSAGKYLPARIYNPHDAYKIKSETINYAKKNGMESLLDANISLGDLSEGRYNSLEITLQKKYEFTFAKIFGVKNTIIKRKAKVSLMPMSGISGVVPIGINESEYTNAQNNNSLNNVTLKYGGGDGENGVFGFIVLDGSKGNANLLLDWMCNGYDEMLYVDDKLPNATGNKASVAKQGVEYRINMCNHFTDIGGCTSTRFNPNCPRIVKTLVYKQINDREIQITGFAPFFIEKVDNMANITGSYVDVQMWGESDSEAFYAGLSSLKLVE